MAGATQEVRGGRGRHNSPKGNPLGLPTWDRVAAAFNARNGTTLTPARVRQIGEGAVAKLRHAFQEHR